MCSSHKYACCFVVTVYFKIQINCIWLWKQLTRKYFAMTLVMFRRVIISRDWYLQVNEWKSVLRCSYRVLVTSQKLTWSVFSYICSYSAWLTVEVTFYVKVATTQLSNEGKGNGLFPGRACSVLAYTSIRPRVTRTSPKLTMYLHHANLVSKEIITHLKSY